MPRLPLLALPIKMGSHGQCGYAGNYPETVRKIVLKISFEIFIPETPQILPNIDCGYAREYIKGGTSTKIFYVEKMFEARVNTL